MNCKLKEHISDTDMQLLWKILKEKILDCKNTGWEEQALTSTTPDRRRKRLIASKKNSHVTSVSTKPRQTIVWQHMWERTI